MPGWFEGFPWPIDQEGVDSLIGVFVDIRFEWTWEEGPGGRKNTTSTWVTITDRRSDLKVREKTFPLAADAFIVAAKRTRIER